MRVRATGSHRMKHCPFQGYAVLIPVLLLLCLQGCAHLFGFVTYYDPATYKNLTSLKPEVLFLYETFVGEVVDTDEIAAIRLKLAQIYEYEKGKGPKNVETAKQVDKIRDMFERHVKDRMKEDRKWDHQHLSNQKETITKAFDIAIETEMLKNKNR